MCGGGGGDNDGRGWAGVEWEGEGGLTLILRVRVARLSVVERVCYQSHVTNTVMRSNRTDGDHNAPKPQTHYDTADWVC